MLEQVVKVDSLEREVHGVDDGGLLVEDFGLGELFAGDFVVDDAELEGVDFLVLGGREHGSDPDQVQVLQLLLLGSRLEVGVHHVHASEEGLFRHLVRRQHLDHPVHHLRSKRRCDPVLRKVPLQTLALADQVVQDIGGVVVGDQLRIGGLEFSRQIHLGRGNREACTLGDFLFELRLFLVEIGVAEVGSVAVLLVLLAVHEGKGLLGSGLVSHV